MPRSSYLLNPQFDYACAFLLLHMRKVRFRSGLHEYKTQGYSFRQCFLAWSPQFDGKIQGSRKVYNHDDVILIPLACVDRPNHRRFFSATSRFNLRLNVMAYSKFNFENSYWCGRASIVILSNT
ncbi:hypothetical protein GA0061081_10528 [Gilliamella bombicola]|uniref:Uncharacterized protein n=1 Tax=Gilliamella bombicola TaxID=1798182 RepID=A0A1C4BMA0_9GAMM|nr:hypothetical protein GA0061081_10528 [Gilliamella bombicola]